MAAGTNGVVGCYTLGGMGIDDVMVDGGTSRIFFDRELPLNMDD